MNIGDRSQHGFHGRDEGVVIEDDAGGRGSKLHSAAFRGVVNDIANEVYRATEQGLNAESQVAVIEAAIPHDADVVSAAIRLDAVILHIADVVVVEVD